MKKLATHLVILVFLMLVVWFPAGAQSENLLTNPGFEDPFTTLENDGRLRVAQGWTHWFIPLTGDIEDDRPIYAPAAPDTARIRGGSNAQQYYSFYAAHRAGVYQRVANVTGGSQLEFGVFVYVWSSNQADVNISEGDGDVMVRVGIDPTGGIDPASASIVWSQPVERYDSFTKYSVTATASGNAVTVFIESAVAIPVQNYIYLDDAALAPVRVVQNPTPDDGGILPTPTSEIPPTNTTVPPTNTTLPPTNTIAATVDTAATATALAQLIPTSTSTIPPTNTVAPTIDSSIPTQETGALPTATTAGALPTATRPSTGGPTTPISDDFPDSLTHVVQRGDTVIELADLYDSTIDAIIEANGLDENALIYRGQSIIIPVRLAAPATSTLTNTPAVIVVTATPGGGQTTDGTVYIIQRGDTLSRIAVRYNTTVAALAQLNGIVNPNRIQVGQRLIVPGTGGPVIVPTSPGAQPTTVPAQTPAGNPTSYTVQPGDNLFRLSLRFNVSMQRLMEVNSIVNANLIYVGQVLVIP